MLLSLLIASVIINEIAWMGTEVSYNDEWIELKNETEENINLEGWKLKADDGTPEINLSGTIHSMGFYLLERTDDETVPEIKADLIYKGALSNNGENLKLHDNDASLANEVNCADGWSAGDNGAKLTMEKVDDNWENSENPGGTPRAENQRAKLIEESLPKQDKGAKLLQYPDGIVFQEIIPSPDGPDSENEWIKIYNSNDFEVDLSGWAIKDVVGRTTTYILKTKIKELSSLTLSRPETKITLNNDGDKLELLNPNKEIVDSVSFEKAVQGQSYIRTASGWTWTRSLAPSVKTSEQNKGAKLIEESLPKQDKGAKLLEIELKEKQRSLAPLFTALIVALFSGIVIIYLNNRLSEHSRLERGRQNRF